jgi:hypothetical protein
MSNGIRLPASLRAAKGLFLVLVLLAVSAALANQICELNERPGSAPHHEDYCGSLTDGALPAPPATPLSSAKPTPFLPLATAWSPERLAG